MANVQFELELVTRQWRQAVTQARQFFARETRTMARDAGSIDEAFSTLNVRPLRDVRGEMARLQTAFRNVRTSGVSSSRDIARAQVALRGRMRELRVEAGGLTGSMARLGVVARPLAATLGGVFSVAGAALFARSVFTAVNTTQQLRGQLNLVTSTTRERVALEQRLFQLAQDTGQEYEGTINLYSRIARSTRDLVATEEDRLGVTRAVQNAIRLSGAGTQEAAAGAQQLGQALASGRLQGDELRSVLENMPALATALADSLGVSVAQLREMGSQGTLTSETVFRALLDQSDELETRAARLPTTLSQAMTRVRNVVQRTLGSIDSLALTDALEELQRTASDPAVQNALRAMAAGIVSLSAQALTLIRPVVVVFDSLATAVKLIASQIAQASAEFVAFIRLFRTRDVEAFNAEMTAIRENFEAVRDEAVLGTSTFESLTRAREEDAQAARDQGVAAIAAGDAVVRAAQDQADAIATLREQAAQGFSTGTGAAETGAVGAATSETRAQVAAYDELSAIIGEIDRAKAAGDATALQGAQARAQAVAEEVRQLEDQAAAKDVLTRLEQQYVRAASSAADALEQQAAVADPVVEPTIELDQFDQQLLALTGKLDAIPSEKTITVNVREVFDGGVAPSTAVPGFARGGLVRGPGGIDNVFARLTRGESVIPAASTRANIDIVRALIRARGRLPGFQVGGVVGESVSRARRASEAGSPAASPTPSGTPINIHLPGGQSFGMSAAPDVARDLAAAVEQMSRKHGRRAASA